MGANQRLSSMEITIRWSCRQVRPETCSTREKAKWASARPFQGAIGWAVALSQSTKMARGIVHIISVMANAIRRKYLLAVKDVFEDRNWLNWAWRRRKAWSVKTNGNMFSIVALITAWDDDIPQYTAETSPNIIGHMWKRKYVGMLLVRAGKQPMSSYILNRWPCVKNSTKQQSEHAWAICKGTHEWRWTPMERARKWDCQLWRLDVSLGKDLVDIRFIINDDYSLLKGL